MLFRSVKLLVPTDGMRHNTTQGEALYDAAADKTLIDTIKANVGPHVEVIEIEGNLDTPAWGEKAAEIMLQVMAEAGIPGKKD